MAKQPNILQITTHDSGRHFGCYGHSTVHTPNIDALAADGVRMTNYFATVPICCASRASMLTGRYPQSHGLMDLCFAPFNWALNDDERHISHILHDAGYRTLLFHIQHEVAWDDIGRLPFDEIRAQDSSPTALDTAEEVCRFLEAESGGAEPFYAQVGFFETHTPFDFGGVKPDTSLGVEIPPYLADDAVARDTMAQFQASVRRADEAVGRIVEALRRSGREHDTLFVFTTDHGIEVPRAKWTLYDPGIAIALVMRCPALGLTGGMACDALAGNVDYLATVLELAGLDVPDRVQGLSFAGALRGGREAPGRDAVFAMYHKSQARCVRTRRHKLIRYFDAAVDYHTVPVRFQDVLMKRGIKQIELFDLDKDPNEFANVAGQDEYADIQRKLDARLWRWMESVDDALLRGPIATPSYRAAISDYQAWKSPC